MDKKTYKKPEIDVLEIETSALLSVSNPTGETDPWEQADDWEQTDAQSTHTI